MRHNFTVHRDRSYCATPSRRSSAYGTRRPNSDTRKRGGADPAGRSAPSTCSRSLGHFYGAGGAPARSTGASMPATHLAKPYCSERFMNDHGRQSRSRLSYLPSPSLSSPFLPPA